MQDQGQYLPEQHETSRGSVEHEIPLRLSLFVLDVFRFALGTMPSSNAARVGFIPSTGSCLSSTCTPPGYISTHVNVRLLLSSA